MPAESKPINYAELKAFITNQFSDDYTIFAPVAESTFKPSAAKIGHAFEFSECHERVQCLLARLPILQERSKDPDEEGDLPVSNETVEQMRLLISVLASRFSSDEALWKGISLNPTPNGGLQISWRTQSNSLCFTLEDGDLKIVTKKGNTRPERTVFSGLNLFK